MKTVVFYCGNRVDVEDALMEMSLGSMEKDIVK